MTNKWYTTPAGLLHNGAEKTGVLVTDVYDGPFPLVNDAVNDDGSAGPRIDIELGYASIKKVSNGSDDHVTVTVCRKVDSGYEWMIYCGDHQVSGLHTNDGKTLANKLRVEGKPTKLCNKLEASEWVAKVTDVADCNFHNMLRRSGRYCQHTSQVLHLTTEGDLVELSEALERYLDGTVAEDEVRPGPDLMSEEDRVVYDNAFIQHMLLAGERGSGKTTLAREVADYYDAVYLEAQLHASMEPWELRAHDRSSNGKILSVLGKFAEAVYWIQQGKRVVLCLDEFLNMNPVYSTVVNTPLSLTKNDTYLIETGRVIDAGDGIGIPEIVEVPADQFWVIATSNVGARYGTEYNPAVIARFKVVLMNSNADRTEKILKKKLAQYGMPTAFATKLRTFMEAINEGVKTNAMQEEATTRLASNAIRAAALKTKRDKKKRVTEADWTPVLKEQLLQEIGQCVNFMSGYLEPTQEGTYIGLVNATF